MPTDWRVRSLPDGRVIEFVDCQWAPDDGTEPPGSIRLDVSYLLDGVVDHRVVLITADDWDKAAAGLDPSEEP